MSEYPHYHASKAARLNEEERRRLRIAVALERCLKGRSGQTGQGQLAVALCGVLFGKTRMPNPQLIDWLLAYGTPSLLMQLRAVVNPAGYGWWLSRAIRRIDPQYLLAREAIRPDWQSFRTVAVPQTALVCFTGSAQKLSVPVQLFHAFVARHFDLVIYLRDASKQLFTQGVPGLAPDMESLFAHIRGQIPVGCHIAVVSASGGGFAAVRFAEWSGASRLAMFSPPSSFKDLGALDTGTRLPPDTVRIYFGRSNEKDARYAAAWGETAYAESLRWFETSSHGTLRHVFECEHADTLVGWLLGGGELPRHMRRPLPDMLRRLALRMRPVVLKGKLHEAFRGK